MGFIGRYYKPAMPAQWILSPGKPRQALAELGFRPADHLPLGFYQCPAPDYKVWVVVLNELPKTVPPAPMVQTSCAPLPNTLTQTRK